MRIVQWLLAVVTAALVLAIAPSARADGIFVTLSAGVSLPRTAAVSFDATTTSNGGGASGGAARPTSTVHLEIDDWTTLAPLLGAALENHVFTARVELTAPNAQGVETTYVTMEYTNAVIRILNVSYTAGSGSPVSTEAFDLSFEKSQTFTPPPSPTTPKRTVIPSHLTRAMVVKPALAADAQIGDAYLKTTQVGGGALARITSLSFSVTAPQASTSGAGAARRPTSAFAITKVPTPSYAGLVGHAFPESGIFFVQHHAGAADTTLFRMTLKLAALTSESIQANGGGATESLSMTAQGFEYAKVSSTPSVPSSFNLRTNVVY